MKLLGKRPPLTLAEQEALRAKRKAKDAARKAQERATLLKVQKYWCPAGIKMNDISRVLTGKSGRHKMVQRVLTLYTRILELNFGNKEGVHFGTAWVQIDKEEMRQILGREYNKIRDLLIREGLLEMKELDEATGEFMEGGYYKIGGYDPETGKGETGETKSYRIPLKKLFDQQGRCFYVIEEHVTNTIHKKMAQIASKASLPVEGNRARVARNMERLILLDCPKSREVVQEIFDKGQSPMSPDFIFEMYNNPAYRPLRVDPFGERLHTMIVNLDGRLREFLRYRDDLDTPLVEVDVRSCQPGIFAILTAQLIEDFVPECREAIPFFEEAEKAPDFQHYRALCLTPELPEGSNPDDQEGIYEYIRDRWNAIWTNGKITRDDAKEIYYLPSFGNHEVLAGYRMEAEEKQIAKLLPLKRRSYEQECALLVARHRLLCARAYWLFNEDFPALMKLFRQIKALDWSAFNPSKKGRYTNNCLLAQRFESRLMFGKLIEGLRRAGLQDYSTIHDSALVKETDVDLSREVFQRELRKLDIPLQLKNKKSKKQRQDAT